MSALTPGCVGARRSGLAAGPVAVAVEVVDIVSDHRHGTLDVRRTVAAAASAVDIAGDRHTGARVVRIARLGLGARLGNGRQYMCMISLRDWVGGTAHLVEGDVDLRGQDLAADDLPVEVGEVRGRAERAPHDGGDVGGALANAATAQRNNLLAAKASTDVRSIGDAYSDLSDIFKRSKEQSEYRRGLNDGIGNQYGTAFGFGG